MTCTVRTLTDGHFLAAGRHSWLCRQMISNHRGLAAWTPGPPPPRPPRRRLAALLRLFALTDHPAENREGVWADRTQPAWGWGEVSHLIDIKDIVAMLAARIGDLAPQLLPGGVRRGPEWVAGSLAGERGKSLAVHLVGAKAGIWADFASGQKGDALDLVAQARCGGNKADALRWARHWLGLDSGAGPRPQRPVVLQARETAEDGERKMRSARALWHGAQPLLNSPGAAYLEWRGVGLARLGRVPGALRYRPDAWCSERGAPAPAMVAAVTCGGQHVATHRTFLAPGGAGKAGIQSAKKVMGQLKGGVIPLHRGLSGKPLRECLDTDTVALCEGIEDGLTLALHMPEWRVLAAVTLGNLADVVLPEAAQDLVLVFDRDGENPAAARGRARAVETLMGQGRSVREIRPPEGFKDFNDWHQAQLRRERVA